MKFILVIMCFLALLWYLLVHESRKDVDSFNYRFDQGPTKSQVESLLEPKDVQVVYWNIAGNLTYEDQRGFTPLEHNLHQLGKGHRTRILVLAEVNVRDLGSGSEKLIQLVGRHFANYSCQKLLRYNEKNDAGFLILSPWPCEEKSLGFLEWVPKNLDPSGQKNYRFLWERPKNGHLPDPRPRAFWGEYDRYFYLVDIPTSKGPLTLAPIHLLNPWPTLIKKKAYERSSGENDTISSAYIDSALSMILAREDQPLFFQIQSLGEKIKRESSKKSENLLLVGDTNVASYLPGLYWLPIPFLQTGLYRRINQFLPSTSKYHRPSIPTLADKRRDLKPAIRVDHAFFRGKSLQVERVETVELSGSDHYPLFIDLVTSDN